MPGERRLERVYQTPICLPVGIKEYQLTLGGSFKSCQACKSRSFHKRVLNLDLSGKGIVIPPPSKNITD